MSQFIKGYLAALGSVIQTDIFILYRKRYTYIFLFVSLLYAFLSLPPRQLEMYEFLWKRFHYQYSPGFAGLSASVLFSINFSLFGFYLLKDRIRHDHKNTFGSVIGATLLIHRVYIYGKFIAAFLYLLSFLVSLYLGSLFMFFVFGECEFNAWQHAKPFIIFGFPTVITTASISITLGSLKRIPHKTINVVYMLTHFMLQLQTLSAMLNDSHQLITALFDYTGLATLYLSYGKVGIAYEGMSVGFFGYGVVDCASHLITVPLRDIPISTELLVTRSFLIAFSLLLVFLSTQWFKVGVVAKNPVRFSLPSLGSLNLLRFRGKARRIPTFFSIISAEMLLIYRLNRTAFGISLLVSLYSLTMPLASAHLFVTPILFLIAAVIVSDSAVRERQTAMLDIRCSLPLASFRFFHKSIAVALFVPVSVLIPTLRFFIAGDPATSVGIIIGVIWIGMIAVTGSLLTSNEKLSLALITGYVLVSVLANTVDSVFIDFGTWRGYAHTDRWQLVVGSFFLVCFSGLIGHLNWQLIRRKARVTF